MLFLSADGGGTKLQIIAFDEHFQLLGSAKGPAVTTTYIERAEVYKNVRETLEKLLISLPKDVKRINGVPIIDRIYRCCVTPAVLPEDVLREMTELRQITVINEPGANLLAGLLKPSGMLTIAGTGSDHFYIKNYEKEYFIGGYGPLLGDEGSGYDLGRQTLLSAIRADENRGPKTILRDMVFKEYALKEKMFELVKIYSSPDSRKQIARATYLLGRAAHMQDPEAIRILTEGGTTLGKDAATLLKNLNISADAALPFTVSGGAWKIHPLLWQKYRETLLCEFPNLLLQIPVFEPAMFGVIHSALEQEGKVTAARLEQLRREFSDFTVKPYTIEN